MLRRTVTTLRSRRYLSDGQRAIAGAVLAVAIIAMASVAFTGQMINFDQERVPQSVEFEPNSGVISTAYDAIRKHHEFPFWNPYVATGVPYLGDPVNYLFNPLGSVPGLIFGAVNGPKVGLLLAVLFSGLSGYCLASVLGLSWPARVWAGVLLAVNGHLAARVFGGQYQLAIAYPFIAFSFAFFIETLRRDHRVFPILAGLSVAMLLFSGMLYYLLFVLPGLIVTFIFYAVASQSRGWQRDELWRLVRRSLAAAAWMLGFSAVLLIPFVQAVHFVGKDSDPLLSNSQTMFSSFLNFLIADHSYYDEGHRGAPPAFLHEYYSYVGLVPLLALSFVLFAFRRGNRLLIALMATLFLFYLAWSSAKYTPFHYAYDLYHPLYNFRWTSRVLAAATPFFVMLGAIGIDELFRLLTARALNPPARRWFDRVSLPALPVGFALAAVALALITFNLIHVLRTNRELLYLQARDPDTRLLAEWLDEREPPAAYLQTADEISPGIILRLAEHGIPRLAPNYWRPRLDTHVAGAPPPEDQLIQPRGEYLAVTLDSANVAAFPDARPLENLLGTDIYRLPDSPPFASLVDSGNLPLGTGTWEGRAQPAQARIVSPNVIEVEATTSGAPFDRVLILESYFKGWRVEVDGKRVGSADNERGFISTEAQPGAHVYRFVFDPTAQKLGLAITIGTAIGAMLYLSPLGARRRNGPSG